MLKSSSAWSITIGLANEPPPTPAQSLAAFVDDYAHFRQRLGRRESLRAALVMLALMQRPIRGNSQNST